MGLCYFHITDGQYYIKGRREHERKKKSAGRCGVIGAFFLWTVLIRRVDVQAVGQNRTKIGFDDLICPEEIISAAADEKKECVDKYISLICNTLDIFLVLLLLLPVFGNGTDSPASVSLYAITGVSAWIKIVFAVLIGVAVLNGICGVIISHFEKPVCALACSRMIQWIILSLNRHRLVTGMVLSVAGAAVFILTRQPYAGIIWLAVLVVKGLLIGKGKNLL